MLSRRQFLHRLMIGMNAIIAVTLAIPAVGYLLTPLLRKVGAAEWVSLGLLPGFQHQEPKRVEFEYTSEVGYVAEQVRGFAYVVDQGGEQKPLVLSPICTHMGCNVLWNSEKRRFVCPCHGGEYDADGQNLAGPPPRPLARLSVRVENGTLMIQPTYQA